ncbi:hypothetical protein SAMN05444359_12362 [Neolewinella agarilytica]|uniref:GLPGLI family protein n=2 Tax=Neolewinella agarilytica TaxID=478744 RepID=A0A1H9LA03_9BACT|nr:hypothetical protein SAMN05444359_12362 [Neolewinella agarilytica]
MKASFFLILSLFMSLVLSGQSEKAIAISYASGSYLSLEDILPPPPDTTDMAPEDAAWELKQYENFAKKLAIKQVKETNELKDTTTYTMYRHQISVDRGSYRLSDDEFRLIDLQEGRRYNYYTQDGVPKAGWSHLHDFENNWTCSYQIDTFPNERTNILGYDCYRMTIREHRIWESMGFEETQHYDLFVTDELPIPFRAVGVLWQPVTDVCALEIRSSNPRTPNSYTHSIAVRVDTDLSPEKLALPEQYKGLKESKN